MKLFSLFNRTSKTGPLQLAILRGNIQKEIRVLKQPWYSNSYSKTIHRVQMLVVVFSIWGDLVKAGKASGDKEIKKLADELRELSKVVQEKEFPNARSRWIRLSNERQLETKVMMGSMNEATDELLLESPNYIDGKKVADAWKILKPTLVFFRFKTVTFQNDPSGKKFVYDTGAEADGAIVTSK